MRIYQNLLEAVKEVERDLWEMGIEVWPRSMQDKDVTGKEEYKTKEIRACGFHLSDTRLRDELQVQQAIQHFWPEPGEGVAIWQYIDQEVTDRMSRHPLNPGNAWECRPELWEEYLHDGRFSYTYAERFACQLAPIIEELAFNPDTRQAILTMHSNVAWVEEIGETFGVPIRSTDLNNIGGEGRIPCSLTYQFMIRENKLDLIYTMRSCDFLTHFLVDILCAIGMQNAVAAELIAEPHENAVSPDLMPGRFTWFCGSLHAYFKDMKARGIF